MVNIFRIVIWLLVIIVTVPGFSQELKFNLVIGHNAESDPILAIAQDKYGFIWFSSQLKGLQRYEGNEVKSYVHDSNNPNSLASNYVEAFVIDKENIFWAGTYGVGLDRFDPTTNTFTHFRHNSKDQTTIISDTITALLSDSKGNLWVGTLGGLSVMNKQTGEFKNYSYSVDDDKTLRSNDVRIIYEDKTGTIWVGCGRPFGNENKKWEDGGLHRFESSTGTFTRFLNDPKDKNSLSNHKVRAIFEDQLGNFWIGTRGDGLHKMDRQTGKFTNYKYDPAGPHKLSAGPQYVMDGVPEDHVVFITSDATGSMLIGNYIQGLNYYNPKTQNVTHYGNAFIGDTYLSQDSLSGLKTNRLWRAFTSRDGTIWISTLGGELYNVRSQDDLLPYYPLGKKGPGANSFFVDTISQNLWIGSDNGLIVRNSKMEQLNLYKHDPLNENSLANDTVTSIVVDSQDKMWISSYNGLSQFDRRNNKFKNWRYNENVEHGLSGKYLNFLLLDHGENVWISTYGNGVDFLDVGTGTFKNFNTRDEPRLSSNLVGTICEDHEFNIWVSTASALTQIHPSRDKCSYFFENIGVSAVFVDSKGVVWASDMNAVYIFDKVNNDFNAFTAPNIKLSLQGVIGIFEDKNNNLWFSATKSIMTLDSTRTKIRVYDESNGVLPNTFSFSDDYVSENGKVFIGNQNGFYAFQPEKLGINDDAFVYINSFKTNDVEAEFGNGNLLSVPIQDTDQIDLRSDQNNFSFGFAGINYMAKGEQQYQYKLENYDNTWSYFGDDDNAYYFNVPPGDYVFHVNALSTNGTLVEKSISIHVDPPWWKSKWAYLLFFGSFIGLVWGFISYRSKNLRIANRTLEESVAKRTEELRQQKEKVEVTLQELKSTQIQLIQSEKMASLGELTAGIAHEIQNPLNFVNNFSELNAELFEELMHEIDKGNFTEVKSIAKGIFDNEAKIAHHGKRAEAIVKGMLQHSRNSSGQKAPTDLNALVDEFSRLSYHGLRAKDKHFNATLNTDLDPRVGMVNIVPQDIGRVLLNLFNNAFYAVHEKKLKMNGQVIGDEKQFEPMISISTQKKGERVQITVKDNGPGIPKHVEDKIFQPFFTTKPAGEGTGLGLSLSYEIVKANGGEISVTSNYGAGAEFIIVLPAST